MSRETGGLLFRKVPAVAMAAVLALLFEILICQPAFWQTLGNREQTPGCTVCYGGQGAEDGGIYVTEKPLQIEVTAGTEPLRSVRFDLVRADGQNGGALTESVPVLLYGTDEGNREYYVLCAYRELFAELIKSQYFKLHTYGACDKLRLDIYAEPGDVVYLKNFAANPHMPMQFSALRLLLAYLTALFFLCCFPFGERSLWRFRKVEGTKPHQSVFGLRSQAIWRLEKMEGDRGQLAVTLAVVALQVGLFLMAVHINPVFQEAPWAHHKQYHELASALAKGQLYLEELPPDTLNGLANPYDYEARMQAMRRSGEQFKWDVAYYHQKYYVYFGVVPVMVFYLPYYLLTGGEFPTWLGIAVVGIFYILGVFRLTSCVAKKYFNNKIPYVTWLLTTLLMVNGSGVFAIMRRPDFYSLPILMAVTLSVWGIGFWIRSVQEETVQAAELVAGCLCMALVAGCRPQLVLASVLIFPIYWESVFRKRLLFSKKSAGKTTLAVLAYVVVAIGLMLYNLRRFGSPFDFGANYNLTTNDMTKRGFAFDRLFVGIFRFLLQPPDVEARFPYLTVVSGWTSYIGQNIAEGIFGGLLPVSLLVVAGILVLGYRRWFPHREVWALALISYGLGLVIVGVDVQGAGILLRYFSDFGWLFYLGAVFAWFSAWYHNGGHTDRAICLTYFQNAAFMVGMAFWFLLLFTDGSETLAEMAPKVFYDFYYQLAFWA